MQETIDGLVKKCLVSRVEGSRVTKYKHRFCNSEFGTLQLSEKSTGIICELFLRGPQTPGELRSRAERLCEFDDVNKVEAELISLMAREEPLVAKLPRQPGKRESRYAHLFSSLPESSTFSITETDEIVTETSDRERIGTLEKKVYELQLSLDELRQKYDHLA